MIPIDDDPGGPNPDDDLGTPGHDTLTGTGGHDTIHGLGGNDTISGLGGADSLFGDDGNDTLKGGTGGDWLNGGTGTDTASYAGESSGATVRLDIGIGLSGSAAGDNYISIENITGSSYNDWLFGNSGANILSGSNGHDDIYANGGNDTIYGGIGNDALDGGTGADKLYGGDGHDTLVGDDYNDSNDVLDGGAGNDLLGAYGGKDTLTGGIGFDIFSFTTIDADDGERLGGSKGKHVIVDFAHGQDELEFGGEQAFEDFFRADFEAFDSNNDGLVTGADIYVTDNWLGMTIDYGEVLHQVYGLTDVEGYQGPGVDTVGLLGVHSLSAGDFVF